MTVLVLVVPLLLRLFRRAPTAVPDAPAGPAMAAASPEAQFATARPSTPEADRPSAHADPVDRKDPR